MPNAGSQQRAEHHGLCPDLPTPKPLGSSACSLSPYPTLPAEKGPVNPLPTSNPSYILPQFFLPSPPSPGYPKACFHFSSAAHLASWKALQDPRDSKQLRPTLQGASRREGRLNPPGPRLPLSQDLLDFSLISHCCRNPDTCWT